MSYLKKIKFSQEIYSNISNNITAYDDKSPYLIENLGQGIRKIYYKDSNETNPVTDIINIETLKHGKHLVKEKIVIMKKNYLIYNKSDVIITHSNDYFDDIKQIIHYSKEGNILERKCTIKGIPGKLDLKYDGTFVYKEKTYQTFKPEYEDNIFIRVMIANSKFKIIENKKAK